MSEELMPLLQAAFRRHCGADSQIASMAILTAGASAQTLRIVGQINGVEGVYILQRDIDGERFLDGIDRGLQAKIQLQALGHIPVAPVMFILDEQDGLGSGYCMKAVAGETLAPRILRDDRFAKARQVMPAQCGGILAKLHGMPVDNLPDLPLRTAEAQLNAYEEAYRETGIYRPVFDLAFRWLRDRLPEAPRVTLVHGDFRLGNLMVDEDGVAAVLDWELAHLGDPAEDVTFMATPSWRFGRIENPVGGFGRREDLYEAYVKAGGTLPDDNALYFWEMFGSLKWGVITLFFATRHLRGISPSVERAAIGRRASEVEIDVMTYIREGKPW